MFVIVWQFEAEEARTAEFLEAYAPGGEWARLFARGSGYLGTDLLEDVSAPGRYLILDRWESEEAFVRFRREHDAEYEALDRACDRLTLSEQRVGAFRPFTPPPPR